MSAALAFDHVDVRFPIFYAHERSLKRSLGGREGGSQHRAAALNDLSFSLAPGSRHAVLGGNAAGKTTLLRVAAGLLQPIKGQVRRCGPAFAVLNLGLGLDPDFSARNTAIGHALLAGHDLRESRRRAERALDFGGLEDDIAAAPLKLLGPGQRLRLGAGIAAALDTEILLFDEVLEHAGPEFLDRLVDHVRHGPPARGAVLVVERSAALLGRLCDSAMVLEGGRLTDQGELYSVIQRHAGRYVF